MTTYVHKLYRKELNPHAGFQITLIDNISEKPNISNIALFMYSWTVISDRLEQLIVIILLYIAMFLLFFLFLFCFAELVNAFNVCLMYKTKS